MKIVIIGGVAGGATAAARLRRIDENAKIVMVERGEYISFANCGLPYHISGVIKDRNSLMVQTPQGFKSRFNVDVRNKTEAVKINREEQKVILKDLITGREYEESYDYVILSPGAEPIRPNLNGADSDRIFTLRNIPDLDRIISGIKKYSPKRAVVIGGGFIGIEVAENLLEKNIKVTLIEAADQILAPLDYEMAAIIHSHIKDKNIELYLKDGVDSFEEKEGYILTNLKSGKRIKSDIVVMAIGVKPEIKLAQDAGLEIGERRGIKVDEYLTTNDKKIFAIGDAIEVTHYVGGNKVLIPLAWPANRQGRVVADNILKGNITKYDGTLGTAILKAFDMTAASTGLNEKQLKMNGMTDYIVSITHGSSHASYYPGAVPLTIKLVFDRDGTILGAQAVGIEGVDKRIDVIAVAIKAKMKVWQLQELELAYAPPFGSAKDPVNIAGYAAENILKGDMEVVYWNDIEKLDMNKTILVDTRTKGENELGTIKNSINLPLDSIRENLDKLDKSKEIVLFCQVGLRGYLAYRILKQNGFRVKNLSGGYKTYSYAVDKQENPDIFDYEQIKPEHITVEPSVSTGNIIKVDACGLQCPGPIMQTYKRMEEIDTGDILEVTSTDVGFAKDIKKWAEKTGNKILNVKIDKNIVTAQIEKGKTVEKKECNSNGDNKTIVVFSNDFDRAIATFVIANGAQAMGKKVTLFFTFWGLAVLRKENFTSKNKTILDKMFGMMIPKGSGKLALSKFNMGGIGAKMMRYVMRSKNVDSLEGMMKSFIQNGGKIIACNMSMDVMGIREEELIEGIEIGGVASYLGEAEDSNLNLFI